MLFKLIGFLLLLATISATWSKAILNLSFYPLCILASVSWVLEYKKNGTTGLKIPKGVVCSIALYVFIALASYLNTQDLDQFKDQALMAVNWVLFIPVWQLILVRDLKDKVLLYLAISVCIGGFLAALWYLGIPVPGMHVHAGRFAPSSSGPVLFGMTGALGVVTGLGLLLRKQQSVISIALIFSGLLSVFASGTKAAVLYLLPGLLVVVLLYGWKSLCLKMKLGLFFGALVVGLLGTYSVRNRLIYDIQSVLNWKESGKEITSSLVYRFHTWYSAVLIFKENPVFGTGLGDYYIEKEKQIDEGILSPYFRHTRDCHSMYFEILATLGFIGLFVWLFMFLNFVLYSRGNWIGLTCIFSFLFFGITVPILRTKFGLLAFLFLMASSPGECTANSQNDAPVEV